MYRFCIFILLFVVPFSIFSQEFTINGKVADSASLEPLAFVNIVINDGQHGGVTDIDGRFRLVSQEKIKSLTFSYVGYSGLRVSVDKKTENLRISLSRKETELSEVLIVAGENPAQRIINNAVANSKSNNPRNISSYTFTSYDKMIFTFNTDSLRKDENTPPDSSDLKLLKVVESQHLFMMESVSEHKYLFPDRSQDKIIATRISGFKDPLFVFLISQMQSTSFYDELISMAGTNYINPISQNSDNLYFFHLKDTIYGKQPGDTTFVIGYKPKPGKNFDGMKGLLYISNNNWAIQNVIAEPARPNEAFGMRIQQMYEFIDSSQWFPVQLNTEIIFNNVNLNKSKPIGIGKSYRRDIKLNTVVNGRELANIAVEITPDAARQNEILWNRYRIDSLTRRELNTYRVIDSLGRANKFDARVRSLTTLISGKIPLGYFDFDLNRLTRYNTYEGFYLGAGLHTSAKLSQWASIGGYWGYGFRDKDTKYGADLGFRIQRYGDLTLKLKYAYDLEETGGTVLFDNVSSAFTPENYRWLYITRMDRCETAEAMLGFRMLRYIKAGLGISRSRKQAAFDYLYQHNREDPALLTSDHTFGKMVAGIKFAWGEKFIRNAENQASLGTRFPVLWLQYTGSRVGFLDGQFDYDKLDLKLKYSFITKLIGKTSIQLTGGLVNRPAPYSELFNGHGSRGFRFSVFSPSSFGTMRADEFLMDKFAAVFFTHSFGKLLYRSKYFEPTLAVVMNAGVGSLKDSWRHRYAPFKTMEKGYYEGGILINNIIKSALSGLGVALLYRAGPYSYDRFGDNLVFKLSFGYGK